MNSLSHNTRYLPHDLNTKYHACKLYTKVKEKKYKGNVKTVTRRYKCSKASLMRWMQRFDGTKESLIPKSKRPITPHKNAHTEQEIKNIKNLLKRNPNIGLSELYGKLIDKYNYNRNPASLFRLLRKLGIFLDKEHQKEPVRKNKIYHTPTEIGTKMQLDVKFVPKKCFCDWDTHKQKFYQYTIIDETTRERFIYAYEEYNSYTTVDFVKRAIIYFGYIPKIIQTDNGAEFTKHGRGEHKHLLDKLCDELGIEHKLIRPYTPRHNGKVERSHRNDNNRFYNSLSFYSLDDLNKQMASYLKRSNNIPSSAIGWLSPLKKRKSLTSIKHNSKKILTPTKAASNI